MLRGETTTAEVVSGVVSLFPGFLRDSVGGTASADHAGSHNEPDIFIDIWHRIKGRDFPKLTINLPDHHGLG